MTTETNEFGIPEDEMADARAEARALAQGKEPPEKKEPEEQAPPEAADEQKASEEQPTEPQKQERARNPDGTFAKAAPEEQQQKKGPLEEFPEEVREKVASLLKQDRQHREKSDSGRLAAYQSKYEEERRKAAQLEQEIAALKKAPPKSLKEISPRFKELAEVDEDTVETFEEFRKRMRDEILAELDEHKKAIQAPEIERQQMEQARQQEEFVRTMDSKCENWREIVFQTGDDGRLVTDKNGNPLFSSQWDHFVKDTPPWERDALVNIQSPDQALWAIAKHTEWLRENGFVQEETPPPVNADADKILQKRQDDLKKVAPQKSNQIPLSQAPSEDISDEATEMRLRKLARESLRKNDPSIYKNAR